MQIVYTSELPPSYVVRSIFLAGPTPRTRDVLSWRPEALSILREHGYDGIVFVPEHRDGATRASYIDQIEWEERCLNIADCILFWVPRVLDTMPAFTTNDEWGSWKYSGKIVFGAPQSAVKTEYQQHYARKLSVPNARTLEATIDYALTMVGSGAYREGGECDVPLYIWKTPSFQSWYRAQRSAGNRLDGAKVEWSFRVGKKRDRVFLWMIHVNVYVAKENRNKVNEVVISRPDISTVLLYYPAQTLDETEIVLVREFRSPASTSDGYIWELPGGSSPNGNEDPLDVASQEVYEETGLTINPKRLHAHGARQVAGTLSAHKANVFSVALTKNELDWLCAQQGIAHGDIASSEQTYVEVKELRSIRTEMLVDWATLGIISQVLTETFS